LKRVGRSEKFWSKEPYVKVENGRLGWGTGGRSDGRPYGGKGQSIEMRANRLARGRRMKGRAKKAQDAR